MSRGYSRDEVVKEPKPAAELRCGYPGHKGTETQRPVDLQIIDSGGMNTESMIEPNPAVKQGIERA